MKLLFSSILFCLTHLVMAQLPTANYDENNIPPYSLPDPLRMENGKKVTSVKIWEQTQRPYIAEKFTTEVFGEIPAKATGQHYKLVKTDEQALNGKAISKQINIYFTNDTSGPHMAVVLYLPKRATKTTVFVGLNFKGNQTIDADPGIIPAVYWQDTNKDFSDVDKTRGIRINRWPLEKIISNGFGLATAHYYDLEPDHKDGWKHGVRTTMAGPLGIKPDAWTAIGAWAWGLSRIQDYLETDAQVDATQTIVIGHSRLGKTALWAGANDLRFARVISNNSGEGGAALSKRYFGETILHLNTNFPHWFTEKYKSYNNQADKLPVDHHQLLALIAPRPLYIASAEDDQWADPKGEYLSLRHSLPVFTLYKKDISGLEKMPDVNHPAGRHARYHIRSGKHDVTPYDWDQFIRFAKETN